jgi:Holliday junction resolvasome RuvABC endonuclease subunit
VAKRYVIGVDPGLTRTGIALVELDGYEWRVVRSAAIKPEQHGDRVRQIGLGCALFLEEDTRGVRAHIEVPSYVGRNVQSALAQVYLTGYIAAMLTDRGVTVKQVNTRTMLVQLGLKGNAARAEKKQAALEIAREHGLSDDRGDDEADACCLAAMTVDDDDA